MIDIKIKICGLTNYDDAMLATELGADMLGFIFYPESPRYISMEKAQEIIRKIPTFVDTVGVFVNATMEQVQLANDEGWLNWIQLHGDETPEFCGSIHWMHTRIIKAIRVKSSEDIERANNYPTDAILFDTFKKGVYGGTGEKFDWSLVLDSISRRVFLSGGINESNVADAVQTGVYGIDISSGVEAEKGKKDHSKMKNLFKIIYETTGGKVKL